jgi:hypothetical protein
VAFATKQTGSYQSAKSHRETHCTAHRVACLVRTVIRRFSTSFATGVRFWHEADQTLSPPHAALNSTHPSSMRTRVADRLLLGAWDAAPEVRANNEVCAVRPGPRPGAGQRTNLRGLQRCRPDWKYLPRLSSRRGGNSGKGDAVGLENIAAEAAHRVVALTITDAAARCPASPLALARTQTAKR